jgi:alpha-amylase
MRALIAWGRFGDRGGQRVTVPGPHSTPPAEYLWDFLRHTDTSMFDALQLPPASMTQSHAAQTGDGYGVEQRRWMGSPTDPTAYGYSENLMALIAAKHAEGTEIWCDMPLHQTAALYSRYLGADRKTWNGRGAQAKGWIRGQQSPILDAEGKFVGWNDPIPPYAQRDPVPDPNNDFAFGAEWVYENCTPQGASLADTIEWVRWFDAKYGADEYRADDGKGVNPRAMRRIMDAIGKPWNAEYFDNVQNSLWWQSTAPISGRCGLLDFDFHWRMQAACNSYDARLIEPGGSLGDTHPDIAYRFLDNPDTDTSRGTDGGIGQQIVFNKMLGYTLLLNMPARAAMVYGKDYFPASVWPGAYGLKPLLDNLLYISGMYAWGKFQRRWVDKDVYAFTRDGNGGNLGWSGGLLVAINFNTVSARTITCGTTFGPHRRWHDETGHIGDGWTDGYGNVTVTIPSNAWSGGESYVCLVPAGYGGAVPKTPKVTTNTIVLDDTGDVTQAKNGVVILPERLRIKGGTVLQFELTADRTGWTAGSEGGPAASEIKAEVFDESDRNLLTQTLGLDTPVVNEHATVHQSGWHTITLTSKGLPAAGSTGMIRVRYMGVK